MQKVQLNGPFFPGNFAHETIVCFCLHDYALADKCILAPKLRIPNIQFTDHIKLKKKEDQSVDTLTLIGKWFKIPMAHSQPNRMSIGSPMEQLERGTKELKWFADLQAEQ